METGQAEPDWYKVGLQRDMHTEGNDEKTSGEVATHVHLLAPRLTAPSTATFVVS